MRLGTYRQELRLLWEMFIDVDSRYKNDPNMGVSIQVSSQPGIRFVTDWKGDFAPNNDSFAKLRD